MKLIDRFLQRYRMKRAAAHLGSSVRLLDIGAFHGELFGFLGTRLKEGFGVEPLASGCRITERYTIVPGFFPSAKPETQDWDAITMLAVLEHIPVSQQAGVVQACYDFLREGGNVIITVPSPAVDYVLAVLRFLRLIDGMSLEEHYGFLPADTEVLFSPPRFRLVKKERFQLGFNYLFVFERLPMPKQQPC